MKRLILIRHCKSSWKNPDLDDKDRPLNKRGKRDAPRMAEYLQSKKYYPDLFLCSPAKRTKITASVIADKIGYPKKDIIYKESLYFASASDLLKQITGTDKSVENLFLTGHNPGITELVNYLQNEKDIFNVPTCAIVIIEFSLKSWNKLKAKSGKLMDFYYPKKNV